MAAVEFQQRMGQRLPYPESRITNLESLIDRESRIDSGFDDPGFGLIRDS